MSVGLCLCMCVYTFHPRCTSPATTNCTTTPLHHPTLFPSTLSMKLPAPPTPIHHFTYNLLKYLSEMLLTLPFGHFARASRHSAVCEEHRTEMPSSPLKGSHLALRFCSAFLAVNRSRKPSLSSKRPDSPCTSRASAPRISNESKRRTFTTRGHGRTKTV